MLERAERLLAWLSTVPDGLVYLLLGTTAAVENIIPPIPADTIVFAGGVLAGADSVHPGWVFAAVWIGNVGSALLVYGIGWRYGESFFAGRLGRLILTPTQLEAMAVAYRRFGIQIIFFSRFLPVFRPVVPAFAGLSRIALWKAALPLATASGLWYGALVYLGAAAGDNLEEIIIVVERIGGWLWLSTAVLVAILGRWWWRTRQRAAGTGTKA